MKEPSETFFEVVSRRVAYATGQAWAFIVAAWLIIMWAVSGPFFHYSSNWQLVINTGTTILTFLMVFVIQNAQNRDSLATHAKLDVIIAALPDASNELQRIEESGERAIQKARDKDA